MKKYFQKIFHDALLTWAALAIGIIASSILYATLSITGLSADISLLIAFITLVGLILLGLLLTPKSILKIRKEAYIDNHIAQQSDDAEPEREPHFISGDRRAIPSVQFPVILNENDTTATAVLSIAQAQVRVTIIDAASILLSNATLTSIVLGAINRVLKDMVVQRVNAVSLTINKLGTELEIQAYEGRIKSQLNRFETIVAIYSEEMARVQELPSPIQLKDQWRSKLEESFYQEMASIAKEGFQKQRSLFSAILQTYHSIYVRGKIRQIEADMILERKLGLFPRRKKH